MGQATFVRASQISVPITVEPQYPFQLTPEEQASAFPPHQIQPGDFVLADEDGVVSFSPSLAEDLLAFCEKAVAADERCMKDLQAGKTITETFKLHRG